MNQEMKEYYLYGASIQGIQSFILQSNELKDIIGASELIEKVCTKMFDEYGKDEEQTVIKAAGNIKYIFRSREECQKAVLDFPKKVVEKAPGITVSQAVVVYNEENSFQDAVNNLERKLKAQRNKTVAVGQSYMSMLKSRQNGMPVESVVKDEYLDAGTIVKRKHNSGKSLMDKCFGSTYSKIIYDTDKMTGINDWIAIIHADGNGLGQVVQKIGNERKKFRKFSIELDNATQDAAKKAFEQISNIYEFEKNGKLPIRPVVLGGDDLTIICRADFAIKYTEIFLKEFEKETKLKLSDIISANSVFKNNEDFLTSCAGIAFIKSSYPFYYGYELAEELCKKAKKEAKRGKANNELAPSCLMFHKVQDSFVVSYDDIIKRELVPSADVSFCYGPYYIKEDNLGKSVSTLLHNITLLNSDEGGAVKTHLRQWISDMYSDIAMANQKRKRFMSRISEKSDLHKLADSSTLKSPYAAYDILSLYSIIYNNTKE